MFSAVEIDAVGYPDEHVAVGDAIVLGHAYADAVASLVDHRLEVTGGVDPVVDGALGGVGGAGEHGEIGAEAVGVASVHSGLALLRSVMPGVAPVGAGLGGVHQGLADRQLRHPIGLAGLVDEPDHLLPYLQIVRQVGAVPAGGGFRRGGGGGADRQRHAPALPGAVGDGDLRGPLCLGDSDPEGQHLLHRHRVRVARGDGVVRTAWADDEATALSYFQDATLVATHPDGWGLRCCGGDSEGCCEDCCRQCGSGALFDTGHLLFLLISVFYRAFASNTIPK